MGIFNSSTSLNNIPQQIFQNNKYGNKKDLCKITLNWKQIWRMFPTSGWQLLNMQFSGKMAKQLAKPHFGVGAAYLGTNGPATG